MKVRTWMGKQMVRNILRFWHIYLKKMGTPPVQHGSTRSIRCILHPPDPPGHQNPGALAFSFTYFRI